METASNGEKCFWETRKWYREPLFKVSPGNGTPLGCRSGTTGNRGKSQREIGQSVWYRVGAQTVPLELYRVNT